MIYIINFRWDLPGVAEHTIVADLENNYEVPHQCLLMEEHMKYGVRLEPRVKEVINPKFEIPQTQGEDFLQASINALSN